MKKRLLAGALLLVAPVALAQEAPLMRAEGVGLETFGVELRLDRVDHATAAGLAASFARFQEDEHGVRRRFGELVRDAHLEIMRRYYAPELVEQQEKEYEAQFQKGYRCEVAGLTPDGDTKATAVLKRTFIESGKQREETSEVALVKNDKGWWIAAIRDRTPDGTWRERGLGTPPALSRMRPPDPVTADASSPKAAVASLRADAQRLGALRLNAQLAHYQRFFDIAAAFYGEDVAAKARADQKRPGPPPETISEIGEPKPRVADLVRVEVAVKELKADRPGESPVVGELAYDLRPAGEGRWRIVAEHMRARPDAPYTPVTVNFGLLYVGPR